MAKQERIWDWDVLRALYLGGMELKDIVRVPRFTALSLTYLQKTASEQKWRAAREAARAESVGAIAKPLITKMGEAEEAHQGWLLETLEGERRKFDAETKGQLAGGKNQLERLKIINQLDETVRRQLGLNERKPVNDEQRNLGILIQMQSINGQTATVTNIQIGGGQVQPQGETHQEREKRLVKEKAAQVAAEILLEAREGNLVEEEPKPLPPGIKSVSPFKIKGEPMGEPGVAGSVPDGGGDGPGPCGPLVNETQADPDIVDLLNANGYNAVDITDMPRASAEVIRERVHNLTTKGDQSGF